MRFVFTYTADVTIEAGSEDEAWAQFEEDFPDYVSAVCLTISA